MKGFPFSIDHHKNVAGHSNLGEQLSRSSRKLCALQNFRLYVEKTDMIQMDLSFCVAWCSFLTLEVFFLFFVFHVLTAIWCMKRRFLFYLPSVLNTF